MATIWLASALGMWFLTAIIGLWLNCLFQTFVQVILSLFLNAAYYVKLLLQARGLCSPPQSLGASQTSNWCLLHPSILHFSTRGPEFRLKSTILKRRNKFLISSEESGNKERPRSDEVLFLASDVRIWYKSFKKMTINYTLIWTTNPNRFFFKLTRYK